MSENLVSLGLALNSAAWVACWYRAVEARAARRVGGWGRRGHAVALSGFVLQLVAGMVLLGAVPGSAIVLGAWMLVGGAFALAVNAWPAPVLAAATWLGAIAGLSLSIALIQAIVISS